MNYKLTLYRVRVIVFTVE